MSTVKFEAARIHFFSDNFAAVAVVVDLLGSLSNEDTDCYEKGEKAIGFDWQNNYLARASRFFVHFLPF